jgi:hypothetical protein
VKHELDVTEEQMLDDLREALGLPKSEEVWDHTESEWTINELRDILGLGDAATRDRAWRAVEEGAMESGKVQISRGHFVDAFRLARREEGSEDE